jgi:hypothetical protein
MLYSGKTSEIQDLDFGLDRLPNNTSARKLSLSVSLVALIGQFNEMENFLFKNVS